MICVVPANLRVRNPGLLRIDRRLVHVGGSIKCLVIDDHSIVVHANNNHPNTQDAIISSTNTHRGHFTTVHYSIQSKLTSLICVMCKIEKAVCEFVG